MIRMFTMKNGPLHYDWCGNLASYDGFVHYKRNFELNVFIYVTEGILYITHNGVERVVQKDQYIFLKKGETHWGYKASKGRLTYYWVHFLDELQIGECVKKEEIEQSNYVFPEYGTAHRPKQIQMLFSQLLIMTRRQMHEGCIADYALSLLMMALTRDYREVSSAHEEKNKEQIEEILDYIRIHYDLKLTLSDVAKEFGYSSNYLSTIIKKQTGNPFTYHVNNMRVEGAKLLLKEQLLPIKEVAYSCGFEDEKYFMRIFKKIVGITPSEYRKSL